MSRPLAPRTKRERMPGGSVTVSSGVASIGSSWCYLKNAKFVAKPFPSLLFISAVKSCFSPRGSCGEGGTLGPASAGLGLLRGRQFPRTAHMLAALLRPPAALGGASADQIALHIREAAENSNDQAFGAGAGVGPRLRQGSKLRLGVHDLLDDGEQIKGAVRQAVNPCHRHHVAGSVARARTCTQPVISA